MEVKKLLDSTLSFSKQPQYVYFLFSIFNSQIWLNKFLDIILIAYCNQSDKHPKTNLTLIVNMFVENYQNTCHRHKCDEYLKN